MDLKSLYASVEPYPTVSVQAPNQTYAQMLSAAFAGSKGEITAITQYLYQSWTLENCAADFTYSLTQIAKVEMLHLNIMGQLITQLGGNPIYRSFQYNRPTLWNAGMVGYHSTLTKALHLNIAHEQAAIDTYQQLSSVIKDECVVAVTQRLVLDEQLHLELFRKYLSEIS